MDGPLFSVITVTRNNIEGLRRTKDSLPPPIAHLYEWIVIDGKSDDDTVHLLRKTHAKWISEADQGIYDAMNKGIEHATGSYLLFLNAGDALASPKTLESLYSLLRVRAGTMDFLYGDALETRPGLPPAYKRARPHKAILYGMFTHHQAMLYRRGLVGTQRYDHTLRIAADYKFTAAFISRCTNIQYWPRPVCLYESGGLSQIDASAGRREQFEIRESLSLCPAMVNHFIVIVQRFTWLVRQRLPGLYWHLRRRDDRRKRPRP